MIDEWAGTSETDPILVDFLPDDEMGMPGRLGMTFAPGMRAGSVRGRWERDLAADMRELEEEYEADVLVSLMEYHEYHGYRIPELLEQDGIGDIEILRFAIQDMGVPREAESEQFEAIIWEIVQRLEQGQNVVVHCRGGLGRTGTVWFVCPGVVNGVRCSRRVASLYGQGKYFCAGTAMTFATRASARTRRPVLSDEHRRSGRASEVVRT